MRTCVDALRCIFSCRCWFSSSSRIGVVLAVLLQLSTPRFRETLIPYSCKHHPKPWYARSHWCLSCFLTPSNVLGYILPISDVYTSPLGVHCVEGQTTTARVVLVLALDPSISMLCRHVWNTAKKMARDSPEHLEAECEFFFSVSIDAPKNI